MAVSIDTVYQKVLALANKEQRGYITPQEFNLFAEQAQMEIFEQYFYDVDQRQRAIGHDIDYANIQVNIEEKVARFEKYDFSATIGTAGSIDLGVQIPNLYRLGIVKIAYAGTSQYNLGEQIQLKELVMENSPLTKFTTSRPVYTMIQNDGNSGVKLKIYPHANPNILNAVNISYVRKPEKPQWGYLVINNKALHDSSASKTTNFELHVSEQSELVYKILKLAGVAMKRDDIMRAGQGMEMAKVQQEKQ